VEVRRDRGVTGKKIFKVWKKIAGSKVHGFDLDKRKISRKKEKEVKNEQLSNRIKRAPWDGRGSLVQNLEEKRGGNDQPTRRK